MNFATMRTILTWGIALSFLVFFPACQDLAVDNQSQPNREQVLGTPEDVEGIASGLFKQYWGTFQGNFFDPRYSPGATMLATMSDTYSSNWANFAMNDMSSQPRIAWNNDPSYSRSASNEGPWFGGYAVVSNAADILSAVSEQEEQFQNEGVDVTRLRAFSNFMMGLVYGNIAAQYDRGFLVDESSDLEAIAAGETDLKLQSYGAVADFGLQKLNKAEELANQGHSAIPPRWIFGLEISSDQFAQLINSYKARFAASTARTADERSSLSHLEGGQVSVDWATVKSWVENGLEANGYSGQFASKTIEYTCDETNCPDAKNIPNEREKTIPAGFAPVSRGGFGADGFDLTKWAGSQQGTWSRADYRMIGPADVSECESGNGEIDCYKEWQDTPVAERSPYVTETPDRRIQGPDGPTDHGTLFDYVGTSFDAFPPARGTYHYSDRTFVRYQYHPEDGGLSGPMTDLSKPEMDLLKAEAILHDNSLGSMDDVADLINNTRVENGQLTPATGSDPVGDMTAGPNPVGDYPTPEPTLWSMLQYEYLIETQMTGGGQAFYTRRGWDDLVEGTPLHFPVPGQELETLSLEIYTFGGEGGRCSAGNPTDCFGPSGSSSSSSKNLQADQGPSVLSPDEVFPSSFVEGVRQTE